MGGMPFYLEKGIQFEVIEDFVNSDRDRLIGALVALRNGAPPSRIGALASSNLNIPGVEGMRTEDERLAHLELDWFGWEQTPSGRSPRSSWTDLLVKADGSPLWWQGYAGDVEAIMSETMQLACEVALGIDRGGDPETGRAEPWPIELFWKCGQNWFEGWVTWRGNGVGGQVTILLCTPSAGSPIRPSPIAPTSLKEAVMPEYSASPDPTTDRGMVVVTHRHHDFVFGRVTFVEERKKGKLVNPFASFWRGSGPIESVSPSAPDGGVTQNQWRFIP